MFMAFTGREESSAAADLQLLRRRQRQLKKQ
jgi:hypothetical protein